MKSPTRAIAELLLSSGVALSHYRDAAPRALEIRPDFLLVLSALLGTQDLSELWRVLLALGGGWLGRPSLLGLAAADGGEAGTASHSGPSLPLVTDELGIRHDGEGRSQPSPTSRAAGEEEPEDPRRLNRPASPEVFEPRAGEHAPARMHTTQGATGLLLFIYFPPAESATRMSFPFRVRWRSRLYHRAVEPPGTSWPIRFRSLSASC